MKTQKKALLLSLVLVSTLILKVAAQEPTLLVKDIAKVPLLDGTKLPVDAGWSITIDDQTLGQASITKTGELSINCNQGETYRMAANPSTDAKFAPTSDYTIEFRIKITENNGRGLDVMIRDGMNSTKLLVFSHNRVMINGEKVPLKSINNKEFHTYRLAVERAKAKLHIYIDKEYLTSLDLDKRGGIPSLLFAKGNVNSATAIVVDYLTFDLSGAFSPK